MTPSRQIVISASRRTDIPAFYMNWFMAGINKGRFEVVNPYNRRTAMVPATPDAVHTIVFWSKNFGPFIEAGFGEKLEDAGYHLFFNFTVNSASSLLEPHVPPLKERLTQMEALCRCHGPKTLHWRFDPICSFHTNDTPWTDNLHDFETIAHTAARCGLKRCITSFMDDYPKIKRRTRALPGFTFFEPPLETKVTLLQHMEKVLMDKNITLQTCCEKALLSVMPSGSRVENGSCIPNDLLTQLFGPGISLGRDPGQRRQKGCGCKVSVDIGSYQLHPCFHNCLFCYANPAPPPSHHLPGPVGGGRK